MSCGSLPGYKRPMTKPKPPGKKKKAGVPPSIIYDPAIAAEIRGMRLANMPVELIATTCRIAENSLRKVYGKELVSGRAKLVGAAATQAARLVYGAKAEFDAGGNCTRAEVKPDSAMVQYVLRTQGKDWGWSEAFQLSRMPLFNDVHLERLTKDELIQFGKLLSKAGVEIDLAGCVGTSGQTRS